MGLEDEPARMAKVSVSSKFSISWQYYVRFLKETHKKEAALEKSIASVSLSFIPSNQVVEANDDNSDSGSVGGDLNKIYGSIHDKDIDPDVDVKNAPASSTVVSPYPSRPMTSTQVNSDHLYGMRQLPQVLGSDYPHLLSHSARGLSNLADLRPQPSPSPTPQMTSSFTASSLFFNYFFADNSL